MNILNICCYYSGAILASVLFLFLLITFGISVYSCFPKKGKENEESHKFTSVLAKVTVAIIIGCLLPLVLKGVVFFFTKAIC